jgi:hypothetical protein
MGLDYRPQTTTAQQFAQIFDAERAQVYPSVDALEARLGYAIDIDRLHDAARVLSCPFKAAAPNWQHGRVIYAAVRARIGSQHAGYYRHVDIGTAKGFSALCAQWAIDDAYMAGQVDSVDVLPQAHRLRRNTAAEVDGLKTLAEVLAPFPESARITFHEMTGVDFLKSFRDRAHSAFVDGKHSAEAVGAEWRLLSEHQDTGDIAIFDDVQMAPVAEGLKGADRAYDFTRVELGHVNRAYLIGVRR